MASSSKKANEHVAKLWRLGLVLGNKEWRADWSPTRDELVRPANHERHKRARTNRIGKLDTAVQSFELREGVEDVECRAL